MKLALVLSGGGAKGAYQVGVVQALVEMGIQIEAVSGASIGALNGAILAAAPDLKQGCERLTQLWQTVHTINAIQMRNFTDLSQMDLPSSILDILPKATIGLASGGLMLNPSILIFLYSILDFNSIGSDSNGLLSSSPLESQLNQYLDLDALQTGLPFYISIFENPSFLKSFFNVFKAEVFGVENELSKFMHIQSLSKSKQKDMIFASAALPILFASKKDEHGMRITDGGQGGWIKQQGNTPITPLIEAGYKNIIVTHLNNGSLWTRNDFKEATVYEIRPSINISPNMAVMLDFSEKFISQLIEAGYQDTMDQIGKIQGSFQNLHQNRIQVDKVHNGFDRLETLQNEMASKLQHLP